MDNVRKRLILDHLHGLLTLREVGEQLGVNTQRAYQLKQKLWAMYRVPVAYQHNGPFCAHWVAMLDRRNASQDWAYDRRLRNSPEFFHYNERFGEYRP